MAPFTLEGACHRTGVETGLAPGTIPTFQPGDGAILDHATWHHGGRRAEVIAAADCPRLDLPPYSPDLNRLEKCWGGLKSRIRQRFSEAANLRPAMEAGLQQAAS